MVLLAINSNLASKYNLHENAQTFHGYYMEEKFCHETSNCSRVPSADSELQLFACPTEPGDPRRGAIVFVKQKAVASGGHDIYRIRMVGPEILTPRLYACNSTTVVAPYNIMVGGVYAVEVVVAYSNFTYNALPQPKNYQNMALATFELDVVSQDQELGCAWQNTCPRCTTAEAEGRWLVRDSTLSKHLRYCNLGLAVDVVGCSNPLVQRLTIKKSVIPGLTWQPYSCRLLSLNEMDLQACLKNRKVCFIGDSQMRHMHMGVSSLIMNDTSYHDIETALGQGEMSSDHEIRNTEFTTYFEDNWGRPWEHNLSICTDIFSNFGQWPASHMAGKFFWPGHQYKLAVETHSDMMLSLKQQGKSVFWVTTPSTAINPRRTGIDDWRTDPLLSLYNSISHNVYSSKGMQIVDVFSVTTALHDISYDGYHFKGVVAYNIDLIILNTICSHVRHGASDVEIT